MRRLLTLVGLALTLTASACDGNSTGPNGSVVGTYRLRTINGQSLPFTFGSGASAVTVVAEQTTLNADGSYVDITRFSDGSTFEENGVYTNNNGALFFQDFDDGIQYSGSVSGNVLTEFFANYTYVFVRD